MACCSTPGDIYDFAADNSLRLSYSYTTPEEFADAVDVLAAVARELRSRACVTAGPGFACPVNLRQYLMVFYE